MPPGVVSGQAFQTVFERTVTAEEALGAGKKSRGLPQCCLFMDPQEIVPILCKGRQVSCQKRVRCLASKGQAH